MSMKLTDIARVTHEHNGHQAERVTSQIAIAAPQARDTSDVASSTVAHSATADDRKLRALARTMTANLMVLQHNVLNHRKLLEAQQNNRAVLRSTTLFELHLSDLEATVKAVNGGTLSCEKRISECMRVFLMFVTNYGDSPKSGLLRKLFIGYTSGEKLFEGSYLPGTLAREYSFKGEPLILDALQQRSASTHEKSIK